MVSFISFKRNKPSLFVDDMILYRENPKETTKKTVRANQQI